MTILILYLHFALFEMICILYHVTISLVHSVVVPCVFSGKTKLTSRRGKIQKLINTQGRIRASMGENVENQ